VTRDCSPRETDFREDRARQEEREQQLHWLISRTEFKGIHTHMNPHFLFNGLKCDYRRLRLGRAGPFSCWRSASPPAAAWALWAACADSPWAAERAPVASGSASAMARWLMPLDSATGLATARAGQCVQADEASHTCCLRMHEPRGRGQPIQVRRLAIVRPTAPKATGFRPARSVASPATARAA
jgi:hypothetical protein